MDQIAQQIQIILQIALFVQFHSPGVKQLILVCSQQEVDVQ